MSDDSKTILIVEDNPLNMKLFQDILEASGYLTVSVQDGREALGAALAQIPDLVVLDIQLPQMSGVEVAKLFRQHPKLKEIPIIAVTALAMKGDEVKIKAAGCNDYLAKPISVVALLDKVKKLLEK